MGSNNLSEIESKCAVVVNSCDSYADVWPLFFSAFISQWPTCRLPVFLNTESKTYHFGDLRLNQDNFYVQGSSKDLWGKRLLYFLNLIKEDYVIVLYDDFILEDKVNVKKITECLSLMEKNGNISVFYFLNSPGKNVDDGIHADFERLGEYNDYRLNSAPALWRRSDLIKFIGEYDNPWAWEAFGTARTYNSGHLFYAAKANHEDTFVYDYNLGGAIRRGKWVGKVVLPAIKKYNLNIDLTRRGFASECLNEGKYSLRWKINFIILGYRMVGLRICYFIFGALKQKYLRWL